MNEVIEIDNINIEDMIYEIRGKQIMLDSDLARLYKCKVGTKDVNKTVKRNINKFPNNIYFQIINKEFDDLKFQFGTLNKNNYFIFFIKYLFLCYT